MPSEPTLYQENLETADTDLDGFKETRDGYLEALRAWGVLVPVEADYIDRIRAEAERRGWMAAIATYAGSGGDDES